MEMTEYSRGCPSEDSIIKIMADEGTSAYNLKNTKLVGRYGKWKRGYLAHDAYYETKAFAEGVVR